MSKEYDDLKKAVIYWKSLDSRDPLKMGAYDVMKAMLALYNESQDDWEDQLDIDELQWWFD